MKHVLQDIIHYVTVVLFVRTHKSTVHWLSISLSQLFSLCQFSRFKKGHPHLSCRFLWPWLPNSGHSDVIGSLGGGLQEISSLPNKILETWKETSFLPYISFHTFCLWSMSPRKDNLKDQRQYTEDGRAWRMKRSWVLNDIETSWNKP